MRRTLLLAGAMLALCPVLLSAQGRFPKEAVVIFKDGFFIKGMAVQKKDIVVDPYSGSAIPVPAGGEYLHVDDGLRRFFFSLVQVQDVLEVKNDPTRDQLRFVREPQPRAHGEPFPIGTTFEEITPFDEKWERVIKIRTQKGIIPITQRITAITPTVILGRTVRYNWNFAYNTKEFDPKFTRKLILDYLKEKAQVKEFEQRALVAKFFAQAGGIELAKHELDELASAFPGEIDKVKDLRAQVNQQQADGEAQEIERMHRVGWHSMAQDGLAAFARDEEKTRALSDKNRLALQDIKTKYETWSTQLAQAKEFLRDFPRETVEDRPVWAAAAKYISEGLGNDSLARLKTFLEIAPQHARELKEGKKPSQRTEDVLALAVTGWLQGDDGAVTDRKAAVLASRTREMLLSYLRTESPEARRQIVNSFTAKHDVPLDTVIRMIRFLPPIQPPAEALPTGRPTKLAIEVPGTNGGDYYVQLPPDYQPERPYPVLVLLHSHREPPDILIKRWQEQAARHGFILAAPVWGNGKRPKYEYSKDEHDIVLDALRDLRRRFNVDSDRVFLFGWEQGANAAFDIGLAHPDQFAGVLPMNGDVSGFPHRYASNAQYLPFYIVEGDRNGRQPGNIRFLFKDWIRGHYPSLYVEYKGRSSEWYAGELPTMMDWIGRKKRFHPLTQMGRYHTGGGVGEEFKTMRACDNRFYWLSTDEINDRHLNTYYGWSKTAQPATLTATIAVVNEAGKKGERIWTQVNIRTGRTVKQVSLWLAPNQVDFSHPVGVRIDGTLYGGYRTIRPSLPILLEELYNSGDRERLFVARLDFRL